MGFEPTASRATIWRANRLRHILHLKSCRYTGMNCFLTEQSKPALTHGLGWMLISIKKPISWCKSVIKIYRHIYTFNRLRGVFACFLTFPAGLRPICYYISIRLSSVDLRRNTDKCMKELRPWGKLFLKKKFPPNPLQKDFNFAICIAFQCLKI